jgi:hypothetical protein
MAQYLGGNAGFTTPEHLQRDKDMLVEKIVELQQRHNATVEVR